MTWNSGETTTPKCLKNTRDVIIFPFEYSSFPTDISLVDSLLKPCDSMTQNPNQKRRVTELIYYRS